MIGEALRYRLRTGRRWARCDRVRLVIAVVVLAVGWVLARASRLHVAGCEPRVFHGINSTSAFWHRPLWLIMQLGNIVVAGVLGCAVGVLLRSARGALVAVLTPLAAWFRPADLGLSVVIRGNRVHGLGFVSGHTTVAWAPATMLAPHLVPRLRPVVYVLAAVIGIARIYVGAHMPLDVVGGRARHPVRRDRTLDRGAPAAIRGHPSDRRARNPRDRRPAVVMF